MGLWCGCDAGGDVLEGRHAQRSWQPAAVGLSSQCLEDLATQCGGPSTTARQLIESVILPRTKGHGCCYAQLLGGQFVLDRPTYYVALSWDVPLEPALRALVQHLQHSVEPRLSSTTATAGTSPQMQQGSSGDAGSSSSSAFVFIDFLCIDFWGNASSTTTTNASNMVPRDQSRTDVSRADVARRSLLRRPRKASTRELLLSPTTSGSCCSFARMTSCPDLSKQDSILRHADMDLYLAEISAVLASSRLPSTRFLVYLDPELRVLSSLGPMHAAWRAMHTGLPMQFFCSDELAWLHYQASHANLQFALHEADEPDSILRTALLADLHESVMATISSSSSSGGIGASGSQMQLTEEQRERMLQQVGAEQQALWRCMLGAVMLDDQVDAASKDKDHLARQLFLKAALLALDGQYRPAMAKLRDAHLVLTSQRGRLFMHCVPVLCLMVRIALQQGSLLEAQRYTSEAQEVCKASGAPLGLAVLNVQACHALVLEGLQQASAAEQEWRSTYIQLDQHLGPRHPLTLGFMGQLGRLVSKMRGRQEEGALLLTECLKSTQRLTAGQPAVYSLISAVGSTQPAPELQHTLAGRHLRLLVSCLSVDLAVVLRQLAISAAQASEEASQLACHCTDQIMAAFTSMDLDGEFEGLACTLQPSHDTEAKRLWKQAVRTLESACGVQHEASCLGRAKAAAEKVVPGILHNPDDAATAGSRYTRDEGTGGSADRAGPPSGQAPQPEVLKALRALQAQVRLLQEVLGTSHHVCTLEAQALLASALDVHGAGAEAEAAWRLVADGRRQLLGEESVHVARALSRLAACLAMQGKLEEGAGAAAAAAAAVVASTGSLSVQSGVALLREAEMHRAAGDLTSAEAALDRAVKAHQHCYGMTNWRTKQVYAALAEVYEEQGRMQDAMKLRATYKVKV